MSQQDIDTLFNQIAGMSIADKLRLAAGVLDKQGDLRMAQAIAQRAVDELTLRRLVEGGK